MQALLLKLSGELFTGQPRAGKTQAGTPFDVAFVLQLVEQIKQLSASYNIGIVVGGGNFFRGAKNGPALGLTKTAADSVGMMATIMNGLMLQDLLQTAGVNCCLVSAYPIAGIANPIDMNNLRAAHASRTVVIFAGGTGNPCFSTDTAAVIRAVQWGAPTIWKATTVDYVYDSDPATNPNAQQLKTVSYDDVLSKKLNIMDLAAITIAQHHKLTIRIFNIFAPQALLDAAKNKNIGSTIL